MKSTASELSPNTDKRPNGMQTPNTQKGIALKEISENPNTKNKTSPTLRKGKTGVKYMAKKLYRLTTF